MCKSDNLDTSYYSDYRIENNLSAELTGEWSNAATWSDKITKISYRANI